MHFKDDLIIIRHARSKHNVGESTELDSSISEWGERQVKNLGNFLKHELNLQDHRWYTSPFLRCLQTSLGIWNAFVNKDEPGEYAPHFDVLPQLREYLNHSGREVFIPRRDEGDFGSFVWSRMQPSGETYHQEFNEIFLQRMHDAFHALDDKSVVVTHGLPALTLLRIATDNARDVPMWDYSLDNASVTWIRRGRVIWHGKNLYHELESWPKDHVYLKLMNQEIPVEKCD